MLSLRKIMPFQILEYKEWIPLGNTAVPSIYPASLKKLRRGYPPLPYGTIAPKSRIIGTKADKKKGAETRPNVQPQVTLPATITLATAMSFAAGAIPVTATVHPTFTMVTHSTI